MLPIPNHAIGGGGQTKTYKLNLMLSRRPAEANIPSASLFFGSEPNAVTVITQE